MTPEQIAVLATDGGPHDMAGAGQSILGVAMQLPTIAQNFKTGGGIPWSEQHSFIHDGVRRFFAPLYRHALVQTIIPALDGIEKKMKIGCRVLDVGCGHGESTLAMGAAFPNSTFVGSDYHVGSIERAQSVNELPNVSFTAEDASRLTKDGNFDVICAFDCWHDMSDPGTVTSNFKTMLKEGGSVFLIEPMAGETIDENRNIVGQVFSGFSTTCCLQCAKASTPEGEKLGTLCPTSRAEALFNKSGFSQFSSVAVPGIATNRVYQVRV